MAIYTFADPAVDHIQGATAIKVAAGVAYVGESIDLTAAEVTALTPLLDLRSGVVAVTPKKSASFKQPPFKSVSQANRQG